MKKKTKIIIGAVAAVLVLGAIANGGKSNNSSTSSTVESEVSSEAVASTVESNVSSETTESTNILMASKLQVADVMNGFGDTVIGQRAYIEITNDELNALTLEQFQEFCNNVVKDSGYNYVSIIATDANKAIFFPGSATEIAQYGDVSPDGMLDQVLGYIILQDDGSYEYESNSEDDTETNDLSINDTEITTDQEDNINSATKSSDLTMGQKNALSSAKKYLNYTAFSHDGLIEQLEYEQYSTEDATYAADNCGADWNEQALSKAKEYLDFSAFSYSGLIDQLEYEKFTKAEATYAADNCGADWNDQAAEKAKSYLDYSSFSKNELIDQLKYEGFTAEQAAYGVEANGY